MSSFPGSNHELAAEGSIAHGLLDEYVSAESHRPAKDGPEEMEACLEGEQPLPMLECPRGLIDLRASVLVASTHAAVPAAASADQHRDAFDVVSHRERVQCPYRQQPVSALEVGRDVSS